MNGDPPIPPTSKNGIFVCSAHAVNGVASGEIVPPKFGPACAVCEIERLRAAATDVIRFRPGDHPDNWMNFEGSDAEWEDMQRTAFANLARALSGDPPSAPETAGEPAGRDHLTPLEQKAMRLLHECRQEQQRLRGLLVEWAEHRPKCKLLSKNPPVERECTCGLTALLWTGPGAIGIAYRDAAKSPEKAKGE